MKVDLDSHNIYHRYLNLPFEIKKPQCFEENPPDIKHIVDLDYDAQEMNLFLSTLGLRVAKCEAFYTPPGKKIPVHTDGDNFVKINKTWGPELAVTRWFELRQDAALIGDPNKIFLGRAYGDSVKRADEEQCDLVYQACTNVASLVNVGIFHGTYNPSSEQGRWTLCFDLAEIGGGNITWLQSLRYFKDFITQLK